MTHPAHRIAQPLFSAVAGPLLGRPRLICLLGIMRSGSTLLTELLLNNPQIVGFGESHVNYAEPDPIGRLRYGALRMTGRLDWGERFLLDKVLHDAHMTDPAQAMAHADFRPLFILRSPAGNMRSLAKMFADKTPDIATDIPALLLGRYAQLAAIADALPADVPVAAISYDRLVADAEGTLAKLTGHFGLKTPLSSDYAVSSRTGKWGVGDGSDNIRSGKIQAPAKAEATPAPAEVEDAYAALCEKLTARAGAAAL